VAGLSKFMFACAALAGFAQPIAAQEAGGPPDPATIDMPDMTPSREAIPDGWKYFYFQKPGVTYADAYADFSECYLFLPSYGLSFERLPMFVSWAEPIEGPRRPPQPPSIYGLAGDVVLAIVSGPLVRRDRIARMRRCMETRGYVRYPLREEIWRQLVDDYSPRTIAMQALAASRPAPDLPQPTR
jgi:hypothetical protein